MSLARLKLIRRLHRSWQPLHLPPTYISRSYLDPSSSGIGYRRIVTCSCTISAILDRNWKNSSSVKILQFEDNSGEARSMATSAPMPAPESSAATPTSMAKMPRGSRQVAMKVAMLSPGFIYEPYKPREPISFWRRWFTPTGWRRTKEDVILELKSAYAINRLRKATGYSKKQFYQQAVTIYKEINTVMAIGNTTLLRKAVTEKMYSTLKNELKRRESMWSRIHWELVEPVVSIRTLRARMIAIDKDNLDKAFIQLTIEFIAKQRFEAYDSKGAVVSGDKTKEVLVKDIWVFERSLFHPGAYWRLCARLTL